MVSEIAVVPIPKDKVGAMWAGVLPHLSRAMDRSEGWTIDGLAQRIQEDRALVWAVFDDRTVIGAFVTEIQCPGPVAYVALLGGERFSAWARHVASVEEWARNAHCKSLVFDGRKGWMRVMRRYGFRPDGGSMTKDL